MKNDYLKGKLKSGFWYFSQSLKTGVVFIEISDMNPHKGLAYVEFETDKGTVGGAYVPENDLWENYLDAIMSDYE